MKLIDVRVAIGDGDGDETTLLGDRITETTVRYFVLTDRKYERLPLYKFEDTFEDLVPECISGIYDDNTTLEVLGYTHIKSGYYINQDNDETDDDMLYEPDDEDFDDDDD